MERMQERYIRWILGVNWRTPGYMVREETQRDLLRLRAGISAWGFEDRLKRGEGSKLARSYLEKIKKREKGIEEISRWEMERLEYLRDGRGEKEEAEEEGKGEWTMEEWIKKEKETQREERWERIRNSRYNK